MINFEELYLKCLPDLVRYASSFVSNEAAATDIAVEMLYKCLERRDIFDTQEGALAYTRVMVKNKCMNYIRHIQSRILYNGVLEKVATAQGESEPHSPETYSSEISAQLYKAIESLPEKTRRIFIMSKIDNIPQKEISVILRVSQKTVEYHISQARKALRDALMDFI